MRLQLVIRIEAALFHQDMGEAQLTVVVNPMLLCPSHRLVPCKAWRLVRWRPSLAQDGKLAIKVRDQKH